jgi:hypothetical protein
VTFTAQYRMVYADRDGRHLRGRRGAGGVFKTTIDRRCAGMTINAFWRYSRVKQYLKDSRALRIEAVVNSPDDLGVARRLPNLPVPVMQQHKHATVL